MCGSTYERCACTASARPGRTERPARSVRRGAGRVPLARGFPKPRRRSPGCGPAGADVASMRTAGVLADEERFRHDAQHPPPHGHRRGLGAVRAAGSLRRLRRHREHRDASGSQATAAVPAVTTAATGRDQEQGHADRGRRRHLRAERVHRQRREDRRGHGRRSREGDRRRRRPEGRGQERDFDSIIPGLSSHKYDLGMSSFTDTKEREKTVDFVTYFSAGTSFYVKARVDRRSTRWPTCAARRSRSRRAPRSRPTPRRRARSAARRR